MCVYYTRLPNGNIENDTYRINELILVYGVYTIGNINGKLLMNKLLSAGINITYEYTSKLVFLRYQ